MPLLDTRGNTGLIDAVCPIDWTHPLNLGLRAFLAAPPGWGGGAKLHDLANHTDAAKYAALAVGVAWATGLNGWAGPRATSAAGVTLSGVVLPPTFSLVAAVRVGMVPGGSEQVISGTGAGLYAGNIDDVSFEVRFAGNNYQNCLATTDAGTDYGPVEGLAQWTYDGTTFRGYWNGVPGGSITVAGGPEDASLTLLTSFFTNGNDLYSLRLLNRVTDPAAEYDQWRRGYPDLLRRVRRWVLLRDDPGAGGGGTTPITPAGSVTATGALTRVVSKALAGSETPGGAVTKLAAKPLAGSATGTGSLAKRAGKAVAGSATGAGSLAKLTAKPLAGSATPAGTLTRSAGKAVAGSTTATGAATKAAAKPLAGSTTGTGAAAKAVSKPLAGSSTGAGALGTVTVKLLAAAGSMTPTGAATRAVSKVDGGSTTGAGAVTKAAAKSLAGGAQPAGSLAKRADKSSAGSATPAGSLSTTRAVLLAVAGSLTAAGSLVRAVFKALAGAVTGTGSLTTVGGEPANVDGLPVTAASGVRSRVAAAVGIMSRVAGGAGVHRTGRG